MINKIAKRKVCSGSRGLKMNYCGMHYFAELKKQNIIREEVEFGQRVIREHTIKQKLS